MARTKHVDGAPVIIKKYANRRLYNTETSTYITLDDLSKMVKDDREFEVVDAKSGDNITQSVLTQIIVDAESKGTSMLPTGFLKQIIALYGDSMQTMVPAYLEASMQTFRKNQTQLRSMIDGAFVGGPFEEIHKRNMAMFDAATSMIRPGAGLGAGLGSVLTPQAPEPEPAKDATSKELSAEEVATLKAQLAALQAKVDKLG
jgi:polyhydroxyalkanoate synthesis repressor PhaR